MQVELVSDNLHHVSWILHVAVPTIARPMVTILMSVCSLCCTAYFARMFIVFEQFDCTVLCSDILPCTILTSGQIILMKGRIAGGGEFFTGGQHNLFGSITVSCHAIIKDWISFCCMHHSRDSQRFLMGRTSPQNCPFSRPASNTRFLGFTWVSPKRHLEQFSHFCRAHSCNQHRQSDRPCYARHL